MKRLDAALESQWTNRTEEQNQLPMVGTIPVLFARLSGERKTCGYTVVSSGLSTPAGHPVISAVCFPN